MRHELLIAIESRNDIRVDYLERKIRIYEKSITSSIGSTERRKTSCGGRAIANQSSKIYRRAYLSWSQKYAGEVAKWFVIPHFRILHRVDFSLGGLEFGLLLVTRANLDQLQLINR